MLPCGQFAVNEMSKLNKHIVQRTALISCFASNQVKTILR